MAPGITHLLTRAFDRIGLALRGRPHTLSLPLSYYRLLTAFEKPGCPVCTVLLQDADRYLANVLYELALDPGIRRAFRARRGLCSEHSWQALQHRGMSLGIALLHQTALNEMLRIMAETPATVSAGDRPGLFQRLFKGGSPSTLVDRLEAADPCVICRMVSEAEQRYLQVLGHYVAERRLAEAYRASDGLCLPHFRLALRAADSAPAREHLAALQQEAWARLKADLDGLIDKSNYQDRHTLTASEANSWARVARMAGERGVFGPDPR